MLDRIRKTVGTKLDRRSYHGQMRVETEQLDGMVWKLERSQFFSEAADDPAWQAFRSGDWSKSLDIFEDERESLTAEAAKYARQGSKFCRLRVVEYPVSAYVQWEMQSLKIIDETGMPVRVLAAGAVRDLERAHPLPEVVILGTRVLYEVCYDDRWAACGARRIDDPAVISQAAAEMAKLWRQAEPLPTYFEREIAPLPPPMS
jgi:hypothetical protein